MHPAFSLFAATLLAFAAPSPAQAERPELSFGLGAFTQPGAEAYVRYIDRPRLGPFAPVYGASISDRGAAWAGAGLAWTWNMAQPGAYVRASTMFGLYEKGSGPDLGGPVQFRSGIELGWRLTPEFRIGIGFDHRSSAGIQKPNPGLNTVHLFFSRALR